MKGALFVIILVAAITACVCSVTPTYGSRKQLAGPPSEFPIHALPDPSAGALNSLSAMIPVDLAASSDASSYTWKESLPVDSAQVFVMCYASPHADKTKLSLVGPDGKPVTLVPSPGVFPIGGSSVPVTNYVFENLPIGTYTLEITTVGTVLDEATKKAMEEAQTDAYVIWFNYAATSISTHLSSYNAELGEDIGLVAQVIEVTNVTRTLLKDSVVSAVLVMDLPDGDVVDLNMHDDGLHSDGEADDGVYGAALEARKTGKYSAQVIIKGTDSAGNEFIRTTQHLINVASAFSLSGFAFGTKSTTNNRIDVQLGVTASDKTVNYRAYSEVWGKSTSSDEDVAVCWISSIVNVNDDSMVVLELDLNWVAMAKAQEPFTLKNVYVQDMNSGIPVATVAEIPLKMEDEGYLHMKSFLAKLGSPTAITDEMRQGVRPLEFDLQANETASGVLLLLHGYCSASNPWLANAADFTNGQFFVNPGASISHDQYAQKVISWAKSFNWRSVLGHSQGGSVATHILNYYWSGADQASTGHLIQSVGTPYQGCSAAGSAASFGKVFGVGCGRNDDLTRDGSLLWLTGITTQTRTQNNYYTTTYEQANFWGDYCNLAVNLVLNFPNDGTAEYDWSQMPGANNKGNTQKWCHSTGMKYTAQYNDHTRNAEINRLAAR